MISNEEAAHLKLKILADGIRFSDEFLKAFEQSFRLMPKRRAYNTSDDASLSRATRIPQEIFLGDVVVSVNFRRNSRWCLDVEEENRFVLTGPGTHGIDIAIKPKPMFLEEKTPAGIPCSAIANLYGGASLAFFTPATCYFFADKTECRFCSLSSTRKEQNEFIGVISPSLAGDVLEVALRSDRQILTQIMLVGGNLRNYNAGFLRHIEITRELNSRQKSPDRPPILKSHIATMPPHDLSLLNELAELDCHITMNIEVFDANRFLEVAPGKAADFGRENLFRALETAAKQAPAKSVHTILIAGLESTKSTIAGIRELPERGITPIVNVFHSDRGTPYEHFPRPKYEELLEIAVTLEEVYQKYKLIPYWNGCGRNALDFEAQQQWFTK